MLFISKICVGKPVIDIDRSHISRAGRSKINDATRIDTRTGAANEADGISNPYLYYAIAYDI